MTLEQRADAILEQFSVSENALAYYAVEHALKLGDAEAAAMRERAAGVAKAYGHDVAGWNSAEQNAAEKIEARIRALPATGEVGRG